MSSTSASRSASLDQIPADGITTSLPNSRNVLIGGVFSVATVLIWLTVIHNRFFTPHEGWFSYYGLLMKDGKVPYRDFYFFTQPLILLITRGISEFGDKLVYFRYYGIAERVSLTAVYYYLLSRRFSAPAAVCGTIASSFCFLDYPTDGLFSYLYTCLLFLLLALACMHKAFQLGPKKVIWMIATGVMAALCFFTKQSNGLLAVLGIAFTLVILSESIKSALPLLFQYAAGLVLGTLPFVGWLFWVGAWPPYLHQVYVGAASSKGGLQAVLFGFFTRQLKPTSVAVFAVLVIAFIALRITKTLSFGIKSRVPQSLTIGAIIASTLAGVAVVTTMPPALTILARKVTELNVNLVFYTLVFTCAWAAWQRCVISDWILRNRSDVPVSLLIASMYWTYSCGMSWNIAQQSTIPSLGLLIAFCYDRVSLRGGRAMSILVLLAAIAITQVGVWHKWNEAFDWEGWSEEISSDKSRPRANQISDYQLARSEVEIYNTILRDIETHTGTEEPILTLFTIPLFNFIGSHRQPTFAPVHYWDVCPDSVARQDAVRVRTLRPKMIVELQLADWVWKIHDDGWRHGASSGQRELKAVVDSLTSSGDYRRLHAFVTPRYEMNLVVWLRER